MAKNITLPTNEDAFKRQWKKFATWLQEHGSEVLKPTNPYELARFTTSEGTGVVYCDKAGRVTSWQGGAQRAYEAWRGGKPWNVGKRAKRSRSLMQRRADQVKDRDGPDCIYCGAHLEDNEATLEHFLDIKYGGSNRIENLGRACQPCNARVSTMSIAEKIRFARDAS